MHGVQLSKQGVANMLPVLKGNTKLRALHFALSSDADALHTLKLDAILSGCTALAELSISTARDWEYHLGVPRFVAGSRSLELMVFIARLIQMVPNLKRLSLHAGPSLVGKQREPLDASRALEMIEATVDGKLESFNGVPIGAIRRADLAHVECDLRHSGPEAGTTSHLSTELPSYRAT